VKRARIFALASAMMAAGSSVSVAQEMEMVGGMPPQAMMGRNGQMMGGPAMGGPAMGGPMMNASYGGMGHGGGYADPSAMGYGAPCDDGCGGGGYGHGGGGEDELWNKVHRPNRWYSTFNYLGLRMEGMAVPALATTSPAGTAQAVAGQLPDATVVIGNEKLGSDWRHGGEVRLGWWLVDGQFLGIEGFFAATETEETNVNITATGASGVILARPYFDFVGNVEDARILAFDNFNNGQATVDLDGAIDVSTESDFQSGGITFRHVMWANFEANTRVDFIGGYRYLRIDETLTIRDRQFTPPFGIVPAVLDERLDLFETENQFHGGEIGIDAQLYEDAWTFQLIGKCAFGNMHQSLDIDGSRTTTSGGASATSVGGLLAQPSNIGSYSDDEYTVIPEAQARVQYAIFENLRIFAGYRFLYITEVLRPGDQIDRVVNETQFNGGPLVGESRPSVNFASGDVWLQGVDAGIEFEW
jgi:hypothetical protein